MRLAFFDEFGHSGAFLARKDPRFGHSPVFGLAGFVMPHQYVRSFATSFLHLKQNILAAELKLNGHHPATWEKKGSDLITTRNINKYPHIREGLLRLLRKLYSSQARVIYYGRVKYMSPDKCNASGLYATVLGHTIRSIDRFCSDHKDQFMMILDQHSDRLKLLETAAKTMFSPNSPARSLIEPPMQVESHLYQTIQAADWIATLIGRLEAFSAEPTQYADWEWAERYFGNAVRNLTTHSKMWKPRPDQIPLPAM